MRKKRGKKGVPRRQKGNEVSVCLTEEGEKHTKSLFHLSKQRGHLQDRHMVYQKQSEDRKKEREGRGGNACRERGLWSRVGELVVTFSKIATPTQPISEASKKKIRHSERTGLRKSEGDSQERKPIRGVL